MPVATLTLSTKNYTSCSLGGWLVVRRAGLRSCREDGRTGRCQRASGTAAARLIGATPILADAMYAPVVTRFLTCDEALDEACAAYCRTIKLMPAMQDWIAVAKEGPQDIVGLERDF